jgi:hypothetical protein
MGCGCVLLALLLLVVFGSIAVPIKAIDGFC